MATKLAADLERMRPEAVRAVEVDMRPVESWYSDHWPMFLPVEKLREAGMLSSARSGRRPPRAWMSPRTGHSGEEEGDARGGAATRLGVTPRLPSGCVPPVNAGRALEHGACK